MAEYTPIYVGNDCSNRRQRRILNMLRQAADDAEELAKVKARLDAVVKECEKINEEKFRMDEALAAKGILNRVLHAARGEESSPQ